MIVYDPEWWKHCENITIGQLIEYIKNNVSPDAVFRVCGDSQFFIHVSMDGDMVYVDDCALSDMPEYEGGEPDELRLEG